MNDLVSVIMPTYNCGQYIAESIRSVQDQTYPNWELIVVDDCSGDDTVNIVQELMKKDNRIQLFSNSSNSGAAVSRNVALRHAKGRWIAFLDSDDLWKPEKLERQIRFMLDNKYAFTYHNNTWINEETGQVEKTVSGKKHVSVFDMYCCCWPGCLTVMYDANIVGLIQIADIKKNNDSAMWLKIVKKADCYLLDENLAYYRHRSGSITPPDIKTKIMWHYKLFHDADNRSPIIAFMLTCLNMAGSFVKKKFYEKIIK